MGLNRLTALGAEQRSGLREDVSKVFQNLASSAYRAPIISPRVASHGDGRGKRFEGVEARFVQSL